MIEFIVIIGIVAVIWLSLGSAKWKAPTTKPADQKAMDAYEKRPSVFVNAAEQTLFFSLLRYQPMGYYVFPKVRLEDVLTVKKSIKDNKLRWSYRGRIKSRHVDFVVCDAGGNFICAIELDGTSHRSKKSKIADEFKDGIFANASLALYRVKTGSDFDTFSQELWLKIKPN